MPGHAEPALSRPKNQMLHKEQPAALNTDGQMTELTKTLTMLVYGQSKVGKSTFAVTSPSPRLILDVENGIKFISGLNIVVWDPKSEEPPKEDGTWDTCLVHVSDYDTVLRAYQWVISGRTPFKSLIIDSISELQAKIIEDVAGRSQLKMQDWGSILRHFTGLLRDMRDMVALPTNSVQCLVLTAMVRDNSGKQVPYVQGQSGVVAPFIVDICGYLSVETFQHEDPTKGTYSVRRLYIANRNDVVVGERVGGRLGSIVEQDDQNIEKMISTIYGDPVPGKTAGTVDK